MWLYHQSLFMCHNSDDAISGLKATDGNLD